MSDPLDLAPGISLPASALQFTFSRSSGPGGQNVNKLSTRAQLRVARADLATALDEGALARFTAIAGPARTTAQGDLLLVCDETRSQRMNRGACIARLRELLLRALRPPKKRRKTKPSRGAKERRLESKRERSRTKSRRSRVDE